MNESDSGRGLEVWRVDLDEHVGFDLLSSEERARADRFVREAKRHEFTVARSALRAVLAEALGRDPREISFGYGEHGRPELEDGGSLNFNLSHSSGMALIAVGETSQLGVDVEERQDGRPLGRLAQRFFSHGEILEYRSFPESEAVDVFYRGWTRKEAYLKAWGTGLTFSSRGFSLSFDRDECRVVETGMPGDDGRDWSFCDLDVGASHAACVCWRGAVPGLVPNLRLFDP
ncbi:MAG: 4'-phosphopantetheinyl transferase superfamily protein [Acidobacteriota bacterium]